MSSSRRIVFSSAPGRSIAIRTYTQAEQDADLEIAAASDAVVNYLIETVPDVYQRLVAAFTARERLGKIAAEAVEGQA